MNWFRLDVLNETANKCFLLLMLNVILVWARISRPVHEFRLLIVMSSENEIKLNDIRCFRMKVVGLQSNNSIWAKDLVVSREHSRNFAFVLLHRS